MHGYEQKAGEYYEEDYIASQVRNDTKVRIALILIVMTKYGGHIVDGKGAFLYEELKK